MKEGKLEPETRVELLPGLMAGRQRYIDSEQWAQENGKYIPAPWLREKKWLDHPRPRKKEPDVRSLPPSSEGTNPNRVWVPTWKTEEFKQQQGAEGSAE